MELITKLKCLFLGHELGYLNFKDNSKYCKRCKRDFRMLPKVRVIPPMPPVKPPKVEGS